MQPRVKSKLWADDSLLASMSDQNTKVNEKQSQPRKEIRESSVPVHSGIDDNDEVEDGTRKIDAAKELQNHVQDDVSDMDYFKSRVKKDWSDSDSGSGSDSDSDDEAAQDDNSSSQQSLSDQDIQKVNAKEQGDASEEEMEREGPSEGSDGDLLGEEKPSKGSTDEKEVLESGRLFVRNLPFTTT